MSTLRTGSRTDVGTGRALAELGVRPGMPGQEITERLDEYGYALLPGVFTRPMLEAFRSRLARQTAAEGTLGGSEVGQEAGTMRLSDLVNKGPEFDVCFTSPELLAGVAHILGAFKLSSVSSRAALPGEGHQALHADWSGRSPAPGEYQACNSMWILDDFTEENGATRVVPGSHRWGRAPEEALDDPFAPHPDERLVLAPAGSLLLFNGHLWHGGTLNRTSSPRRALHAYFTRRENPQQLDQARYARPETLARLGPAARFVLDA
ncbi:phytanoyl-CoA dioxygenase family protein [Streptomyces sp. NPDC006290]|uniref:phytanoyl-CoA dioxygenase family protein n=1 Tax=Streptomyces sp. NPDC006290 TaxID=3156745 RepID=UPI0033AE6657